MFDRFYIKLYTSESKNIIALMKNFLKNFHIPQISTQYKSLLETEM